jgi:hypothetical protein
VGRKYFVHFLMAASARTENQLCPLRSNFGLKFARDSIHSANGTTGGVRLPELGGLAMGSAYPPDRKQEFLDKPECRDESPLASEEEYTDEEYSDGVLSLLEENARLRGLVIKLTDIILKNVADQK